MADRGILNEHDETNRARRVQIRMKGNECTRVYRVREKLSGSSFLVRVLRARKSVQIES